MFSVGPEKEPAFGASWHSAQSYPAADGVEELTRLKSCSPLSTEALDATGNLPRPRTP